MPREIKMDTWSSALHRYPARLSRRGSQPGRSSLQGCRRHQRQTLLYVLGREGVDGREVIDTEALDALRRAEEEMAAKAMGATAVVESPFNAAEKWVLVSP